MFAHLSGAQKPALPEMRRHGAVQRRRGIHLSAVIAIASYTFGAALTALLDASMLKEVLRESAGVYLQLMALAWFLMVVGLIQRYMGIPLSAARTEMPSELCTTGPFLYSRNPIYVAFIVPLAALGYFSPLAAAISIATYVPATTWLVICGEERMLQSRFGAVFLAYRNRTPRWILIKTRPPLLSSGEQSESPSR